MILFHYMCHFSVVYSLSSLFLSSINTCLCRYFQGGLVSTKIDVYALGVVLYELISAREAVVKYSENSAREIDEDSTRALGLVAMVISRFFYFRHLKYATFLCFHDCSLYHYMTLYFSLFTGIFYTV